ncbi:centrosomal protein of 192 kDa [Orycteropus afer afer]|uniref:Centrosomal protein of 192 kDa n=1 Tax=Orycteropus afer afer TaxID=1230840 RepID=A0A8B7AQ87_ORYAF|nr:centrosomal protein of 192 kDa [Orycteropus afer afer]
MFVARSIAADHKDLIHDVSFDFHGRRMATCSSDQSVKVWDKSENGDWHCTASWKTHSGSVWRVTWAHPEFGQVLASCSFDRTAAVWEEIVGESNDKLRGQSHWVKRTTLVDSRTSVTDVKFAPKHMGLMLATCSADGIVRIYEAPDVMNLSQWSLQHEISCKLSCSCISWNPSSSRAHSPMIAVGSDDSSPNAMAKVQIFEYNENTRKYAKAETLMTVTDPVHDIAFAPNLGRSFHILAVATKDVRIFTLKPVRKELTSSGGPTKFEIHIVAQFDNHNSQVWRVSWNITGTVLASSGDDGCVRLWKANYMDNWKCTGILKGNGSPVNGNSQQGNSNPSLGSNIPNLQNSLNGSSAGRYFFPPLDSPQAGSRWSSYAQLLPPPPPLPPLVEHSCDADTANLQYPHPRRRFISQPLNPLPENEGWTLFVYSGSAALPLSQPIRQAQLQTGYADLTQSPIPFLYIIQSKASIRVSAPHVLPRADVNQRGARAGQLRTVAGVLHARLRLSSLGDSWHHRKYFCNCSEMEDFRGIAEESFPSFSTSSLLGNSGILENVTLSSNLGLPVAVSTLVRNRASTDNRCSDIQASYLVEGGFSVPSETSHSRQSDAEPKRKLQLSFHDDDSLSRKKNQMETQHLSDDLIRESSLQGEIAGTEEEQIQIAKSFQGRDIYDGISLLQQVQDSPIDFCLQSSWMNNKDHEIVKPDTGIHFEEKTPKSDLSHTILLENEKLTSLTSFEDSSDDDIDDEEFYDDHLEAYFEQLAIPGMIYEDMEGQETAENDFKLPTSDSNQESIREEVLVKVKTTGATDVKLNPVCFHDTNAEKGDFGLTEPLKQGTEFLHKKKHLESYSEALLNLDECVDTETSKVYILKNVDITSLTPVIDNGIKSADVTWSPNSERRTCDCYESIEKSKNQLDLPQSVVYQNEEGKWVTDLAYYTSFNKEQDLNMSLTNEMNEDFRSGAEALALIVKDEEEFNKEHQFMQEENIDAQNTSFALGDASWGTSVNFSLLRKSFSTSDLDRDDASYLRLSLGEFFAQRSEALGCLGGGNNVKRPSFGYFIRSPEKREPVALVQKLDSSRSNLEKEMAHLNQNLFAGDLNEQSKAQVSEGLVTLKVEELENISQEDESDVTLTADTDNMEDSFLMKSKHKRYKDELSDSGNSMLRISTIASAITNASINTDPSQLAAMIKALSNKTKEKTLQENNKQKKFSAASHFLPNDLEKSNGSNAFDIEKYLKKADINKSEIGLENFSKADMSDIWDLSLPKEQTIQAIRTVDLDATNLSGTEPEENTATLYSENKESENQELFRTIHSSNPVLTNIRENETMIVNVKTYSSDTKLRDICNGEKAASLSTPASDSYSLERISTIISPGLLKESEDMKSNREDERNEYVSESSKSEKRVIFEKHSVISCGNVGLKDIPLKHGGHGLEDDQSSFRPSASPLSHSSPSEASGTNLSGCTLECLGSTAHPQKLPSESSLSRLACSHTSMSRLMYLSEHESSYPVLTTDYDNEDCQSDVTSELSTTIIQASPTPPEEHTVENLKEKVPFQGKGKRTLSYFIQNNLEKKKVTETTFLSGKTEDVKPNFRMCKDLSSKSEDLFETSPVSLASNPHELDQINMALPRRACLSHQALSATVDPCVSCPESVNKGQRMTSKDMLTASSELSGQIPNQTAPDNQCSPISSFEGQCSAPEVDHLPVAIPTLLTGQSLTTTPFAQPYLGALPSAGNVTLPPCHIGGATVCGYLGGCPHSALLEEHVQNSVAVGICLGQNCSSGLMGTTSLCNPYSNALNQNLLSTAKAFPMQSVGSSCGIGPWDSGRISEFGNVRVPEELKFPHACCVGIVSQTHLTVLNPVNRWLQVSIGVLSLTVNGEKVDLSTYQCLVFKSKIIIRPHTTEEIKVLFIPSNPGIFRCIFSVASWPFSAAAETIVQAEALASRVILTAVAETPVIEVETENKDILDFGDLAYGGWKALPLKLINRTHATVPVRLVINANAIAWRCFTFSKEPINASLKAAPDADVIAQLEAPSVINHVMPASRDGQDPEFLIIWVLFCNPKKQICSSEILDSAEEFLARVDVELDSPNPTPVIKSVSLRARTGIARIHAPKDLQTMHLLASVASSTKQHLPLKNAGNIEVYLNIKIPDQGSHFSVDPENLFLKPGEEHEVTVSFTPRDSEDCEKRIMKIFVQPFGPQYEVVLKGEVVSSGNKPLTIGSCCSDIPSILSNKQFLAWGGVPLGRTQLQKLALRNNSTSTAQHLRLVIRGQDQDCFQLQNIFGSEERLTSNCEIRIHPKEDIDICVLFAPTRLSCMLAKLEIKQLGIQSQLGVKFTIPLSGYGGTSNLILEDVKKLSDSYMVTMNELIPGKESQIVFSVRNTGSRAAFVKAVCFKNSQTKVLLDPKVMRIFPDKFVLKERTQEHVTVIYNPSDRESSYKTATELSTIYFLCGDEISRQQYRRTLLHKPGIIEQILPEHSLLQNINFTEAFQDELLVTEVYDLPQRPHDIQLFFGNMRKIILSVIGEFRDSVSTGEFLQPSSKTSLESKSDSGTSGKHSGNISLDVLPVKGPQGFPLLSQAVHPPKDKFASEEVWAVQPEHLILIAPSPCDMAKTRRFQILNNSVRSLKFELYWPAHCLTVTPQHGVIEPKSKLQILVSPNSSLSTKHSVFPWSGLIYIHCDNGQKKIVKVQIQEDLTREERPFTCLASSPFGILPLMSELSIGHLVKPMTQPPSTKVEIRNKTISFPTTEPGETSENYLELENHGNTEIKWHLSSLAPAYVKGVDESGDVFRATYAAFRCTPISGILESHGILKVCITFLPRDGGNYAQFWDVECHPLKEPHMKHTLRFQLSGKSIKAESDPESACISTDTLIKIDNSVRPRRRAVSEASALIPSKQIDLNRHGVYAPEDVYMFLPTRVGDSRTLKVNLRNNSFITHLLKFLSPREPFCIKHSKYSLRAQHYINIPVQFKPQLAGTFEALLVIQTDEGKSVAIRLLGEALEKK